MAESQWIDWALKAVMGLVSIFVVLLGRDLKRSEDAMRSATNRLRSELGLELQLRDQRLDDLAQRADHAGQKSSDEANRVLVKIGDLEHRMTVIETRLARHSAP